MISQGRRPNPIRKMKLPKNVCAPIATLTLVGSLIGGANAANILVDPGFEDPSNFQGLGLTVTNFNTHQGKWGTESGTLSGAADSIVPFDSTMLSMTADGVTAQTFQFTSLAPYTALVASGNATFSASAMYNFGGGVLAVGAISVEFYTAAEWGSNFGATGSSRSLDTDVSTWEDISVSGAIPTNAVWMSTQVIYNSDSLDLGQGFVDNASLSIVPEPSASALLGLGALGWASRRRRAS